VTQNEDIAAIAAAIAALSQALETAEPQTAERASRWKAASRRPELEIEEIRALY
jgi:hypothetical protein